MSSNDEDYVYDEASGEWLPASEARERAAAANALPQAKDAVGNLLSDGDSVVLIKDLPVKGAGQTWCCERSSCGSVRVVPFLSRVPAKAGTHLRSVPVCTFR